MERESVVKDEFETYASEWVLRGMSEIYQQLEGRPIDGMVIHVMVGEDVFLLALARDGDKERLLMRGRDSIDRVLVKHPSTRTIDLKRHSPNAH